MSQLSHNACYFLTGPFYASYGEPLDYAEFLDDLAADLVVNGVDESKKAARERVSAAVVAERGKRRWTLEDLAKAAGVPVRTIQNVEHGTLPQPRTRAGIEAAFGWEEGEILRIAKGVRSGESPSFPAPGPGETSPLADHLGASAAQNTVAGIQARIEALDPAELLRFKEDIGAVRPPAGFEDFSWIELGVLVTDGPKGALKPARKKARSIVDQRGYLLALMQGEHILHEP